MLLQFSFCDSDHVTSCKLLILNDRVNYDCFNSIKSFWNYSISDHCKAESLAINFQSLISVKFGMFNLSEMLQNEITLFILVLKEV